MPEDNSPSTELEEKEDKSSSTELKEKEDKLSSAQLAELETLREKVAKYDPILKELKTKQTQLEQKVKTFQDQKLKTETKVEENSTDQKLDLLLKQQESLQQELNQQKIENNRIRVTSKFGKPYIPELITGDTEDEILESLEKSNLVFEKIYNEAKEDMVKFSAIPPDKVKGGSKHEMENKKDDAVETGKVSIDGGSIKEKEAIKLLTRNDIKKLSRKELDKLMLG